MVERGAPTFENQLRRQDERTADIERRLREMQTPREAPPEGTGKEYATVVVAAPNTHPSGRASADFVWAGPDTLQDAISQLPRSLSVDFPRTGRILFLEGDYDGGDGMVIDTSGMGPSGTDDLEGLELCGLGFGTRFYGGSHDHFLAVNCFRFAIRDMWFSLNDVTHSGIYIYNNSFDSVIEHMYIEGGEPGVMISVWNDGCDDLEVRGCYIPSAHAGIRIEGAAWTCKIRDNHIYGAFDDVGIGIAIEDGLGHVVNGNDIWGFEEGVQIIDSDNCVVSDNYIRDCFNGVEVYGDFCKITNNHIEEPSQDGIFIDAYWSVISGNTILEPARDGISGVDCVGARITDNVVNFFSINFTHSIGRHGIVVGDALSHCEGNLVYFCGGDNGIYVKANAAGSICVNNNVDSHAGTNGILWEGATEGIISDNRIASASASGTFNPTGSPLKVTGGALMKIGDNVIYDSGFHEFDGHGMDLQLTVSSVTDNIVESSNSGIVLQSASDSNVVNGNNIECDDDGIVLVALCDENNIIGNKIVAGDDGIRLIATSDRNNIQANLIHSTSGNEIDIESSTCDTNKMTNNYYPGGAFNDSGTGTITAAGNSA